MQIASKLANYSLGEGDVLRRAMGKKEMEEMSKQREKFRLGALENAIGHDVSMGIFDKMEKFAAYGFNKSHAAAYGYIAYVTAYLKANYPKEWMAALMTCDSHDLTKVAKFIRECQAMHIEILPPDVNEADLSFIAAPQGIRFAMSGIKGVGSGVVEAIVRERTKNGIYKSLYDFIKRVDTSRVGKKVIESLVDAGSFDFTGWSRDALRMSVEPMYATAVKEQKEAHAGILSLFSLMGDNSNDHFNVPPKVIHPTSKENILLKEKELLGFFLTGHPMDAYKDILGRLSCVPLRRVETMDHDAIFRSAVIIESVTVRFSSKNQKKFAILMISDGLESFELPIWSDLYEEKHPLLRENQLVYAIFQLDLSEGHPRLSCRWLDDLSRATDQMIRECDAAFDKAKFQVARIAQAKKNGEAAKNKKMNGSNTELKSNQLKKLHLTLDANQVRHSHILEIKKVFEAHRGENSVQIDFLSAGSVIAALHIDKPWGVNLTPELESKIKQFSALFAQN